MTFPSFSTVLLSTLALTASTTLCAQRVPTQQPITPVPSVSQILDGLLTSATEAKDETDLLAELLDDYLEIPANWTPRGSVATTHQVLTNAFGTPLNYGHSGLYSAGAGGAAVPRFHTVGEAEFGLRASIDGLELLPADMRHPAFTSIPVISGWPYRMQAFLYTASFGGGPEHLGSAIRFYNAGRSFIVFAPGVAIPANSLITGSDALAFYRETVTHEWQGVSFSDWALSRAPRTLRSSASSNMPDCDIEAARECLQQAALGFVTRQADNDEKHKKNMDEILEEFGDGATDSLWTWLGSGTAAGALGGAVAGAPAGGIGAAPGAATGGLLGAIGGGIGWLFDTEAKAKAAQREFERERRRHAEERCDNFEQAADEMRDCVSELCPELQAALENWLADAGAQLGC